MPTLEQPLPAQGQRPEYDLVTDHAVVRIQDLAKYYSRGGDRVAAVDGISIEVPPKRFEVLRGPSGSGKSTLLLAAGGLLHPDGGQVIVCGEDLYAMSPGKRAAFRGHNIGFVFQQFHLVPYLTVLENAKMPGLALNIDNLDDRAAQLLARFRLGHRLKHFPSELSTGERQRVALARALIADPGVLLADEPTGNLDMENEQIIVDCLREYVEKGGAVLMATHGLRADGFDQVYELKDGKLQT